MSIESTADWNGLRAVATVARQTLALLVHHVRAGITTGELDGMAGRFFEASGARSAPALVYGFPGSVLISINEEIVHGIPGGRRITAGDLVSVDVTVEKDGYVADAARTVVVAPGSETAHRLVACTSAAFEGALVVARAGVRVSEIGRAVEREVRRQGFSVVQGLAGHGVRADDSRATIRSQRMGSPPAGRSDGGPGAYDRADGQRWLRSPCGEERRLDDLHSRWKSGRPLRGHARDYSRAAHRVDSSGGITSEWSRRARS